MGHYKLDPDTSVEARDGEVRWIDYGEIRKLDPEDAEWLGRQLLIAGVEARGNDGV